MMDELFRVARERHDAYLRRRDEQGSWAEDPIVASYRLPNVYPELDRQTTWVRTRLRERFRGTRDVVPVIVAARALYPVGCADVAESWLTEEAGYMQPWDNALVSKRVARDVGLTKRRKTTLLGVTRFMDWWDYQGQYEFLDDRGRPLLHPDTAHDTMRANGVGGRAARLATHDLARVGAVIVPDPNGWAPFVDPALQRAVRRLTSEGTLQRFTGGGSVPTVTDVLTTIVRVTRLSTQDRHWPNSSDPDWPAWGAPEAEAALRLFDAYERARRCQGPTVRAFHPDKAAPMLPRGLGGL